MSDNGDWQMQEHHATTEQVTDAVRALKRESESWQRKYEEVFQEQCKSRSLESNMQDRMSELKNLNVKLAAERDAAAHLTADVRCEQAVGVASENGEVLRHGGPHGATRGGIGGDPTCLGVPSHL